MHARREEKKLSDNTRNAPYLMIPSNFCIPSGTWCPSRRGRAGGRAPHGRGRHSHLALEARRTAVVDARSHGHPAVAA